MHGGIEKIGESITGNIDGSKSNWARDIACHTRDVEDHRLRGLQDRTTPAGPWWLRGLRGWMGWSQ